MNNDKMIENLKELLRGGGTDDFIVRCYEIEKIYDSQIDRIHLRFGEEEKFSHIIDKILEKYSSDKYRDRWYNRRIEPPETLLWYFASYAEKYGRTCNDIEWETYGNMFTNELYYINGYYFNTMLGQGCAILVEKKR